GAQYRGGQQRGGAPRGTPPGHPRAPPAGCSPPPAAVAQPAGSTRVSRCRHSRSERRSVRGRYQTGEGSSPAPVPVLCAPDRERGVPRVPAAPRHVWALSPAGALAPGARPATGHEPLLRGVWQRAVPPYHSLTRVACQSSGDTPETLSFVNDQRCWPVKKSNGERLTWQDYLCLRFWRNHAKNSGGSYMGGCGFVGRSCALRRIPWSVPWCLPCFPNTPGFL